MLESKEKNIDGFKMTISPLPARRALRVLHRLGKSVSPAVAKMLGLFTGGAQASLATLDVGSMGSALTSFFENCSEQDLDYFVDELLGPSLVDDKPIKATMDIVFQGKLLALLKALVFAVEVNYSDFLGGLRVAIAQAQATPKTALPSKAS